MGFYGNNVITHIPRSHFDIVLTVANRQELNNSSTIAKLNMYDYVLVYYGDNENEKKANFDIDKSSGFNYNYHNTIWQKGYQLITSKDPQTGERIQTTITTMIAIAKLDSVLPTYYQENTQEAPIIYTMNQVPVVVNEPLGYDNFGETSATIPDDFNESGTVQLNTQFTKDGEVLYSPAVDELTSYGTDTYTYLTH